MTKLEIVVNNRGWFDFYLLDDDENRVQVKPAFEHDFGRIKLFFEKNADYITNEYKKPFENK